MKQFKAANFSRKRARQELKEFAHLLNDPLKPELRERDDILPFFSAREQLIREPLRSTGRGMSGCILIRLVSVPRIAARA
jgi:hypothetical protein